MNPWLLSFRHNWLDHESCKSIELSEGGRGTRYHPETLCLIFSNYGMTWILINFSAPTTTHMVATFAGWLAGWLTDCGRAKYAYIIVNNS